eukprot:scaffold22785_cov24-Prasinocladus_malaysianus.AAC.1
MGLGQARLPPEAVRCEGDRALGNGVLVGLLYEPQVTDLLHDVLPDLERPVRLPDGNARAVRAPVHAAGDSPGYPLLQHGEAVGRDHKHMYGRVGRPDGQPALVVGPLPAHDEVGAFDLTHSEGPVGHVEDVK